MAEQEQDRSENATPFKLQEAKRRGQVMKSMDVNSFLLIGGVLALFSLWGLHFLVAGLRVQRAIFAQASVVQFDVADFTAWLATIVRAVGSILAPFFLLVLVLPILSNMFQTGPVFTFFPLKPDPNRLNPVQGFKRVFSLRMLFEAMKTFVKLALFSGIAYLVIVNMFPTVLGMSQIDPRGYPPILLDAVSGLLFKLVLALLFVALLDLLYTRWDYAKKMRMSRRELKEEVKRREGDPQVRAKIKELQREAAKRARSVQRVPDADVLITNPTHFAVALQYRRETMNAPCLIAKGAGETAEKMKAFARRLDVPVLERPSLARQLFREVDIDQPISEAVYEPVARVYAELYAAREQRSVRVEVQP